jgi:hypothetical protein
MKTLARTAALALLAGGLFNGAQAQKLRIESPQNGATVAPVSGMSNAVVIRFKTDDFKLVRVNENGSTNQVASSTTTTTTASGTNPMDASASRPDVGATPAPTGSAKQEDMTTQSTTNMPQSDQPASTTTTSTGASTGNVKTDRGQIRVTVDNSNWQFLHSSKDPITIVGLTPGQHSVKLELVGANGMAVGSAETVNFNVGGSR